MDPLGSLRYFLMNDFTEPESFLKSFANHLKISFSLMEFPFTSTASEELINFFVSFSRVLSRVFPVKGSS